MSFAIVTPSFNKGPYLQRCLLSVLSQHRADLDYWVLDACSTDSSPAILFDLQQRYPHHLHVIIEKDDGQSDAINRGFARADGEIMGWLNADDRYLPHALDRVAKVFDAHPEIDLVYGRSRFVDARGRFRKNHTVLAAHPRLLRSYNFIAQPAAFWRRRVWDAAGPLDIRLNWVMDWDFFLRASRRFRIAFLDAYLAEEVWDGDNKTATGGAARTHELATVARRHGGAWNPTYLYCHYVLALHHCAAPWLRDPGTASIARQALRLTSQALVLPLKCLGVHVMF